MKRLSSGFALFLIGQERKYYPCWQHNSIALQGVLHDCGRTSYSSGNIREFSYYS